MADGALARRFLARQAVRGLLHLGEPVPTDIFIWANASDPPVSPGKISEDTATAVNHEFSGSIFSQAERDYFSGFGSMPA